MCTNQLAWLTLQMVCQPVNLVERGVRGNSYLSLTVKGVRWIDELDGWSDGKMLLMAGSGRVKGQLGKTTSGTIPWRKKKRSNKDNCISVKGRKSLLSPTELLLSYTGWNILKFLLLPPPQHWLLANLTLLLHFFEPARTLGYEGLKMIMYGIWELFIILVLLISFSELCDISAGI